jgi:hypothetical protein
MSRAHFGLNMMIKNADITSITSILHQRVVYVNMYIGG